MSSPEETTCTHGKHRTCECEGDNISLASLDIQLRQLPYPYLAALAICSDLDETPDRHVYREIMRFLNTTETTCMGPGVGLEVGNTIYFDMPTDQFAYWNTDDAGRDMIRTLIQSGHIDCLHSFGDLSTTRQHAAQALEELEKHGCKLEVWIDHGIAPTNFDPEIMQGHGDQEDHRAYHADLTTGYGIKYVWRGRATSIVGQDVGASFAGIAKWSHPAASCRTLLKEATKHQLARLGNSRYAMHGPNKILRSAALRDGRPIYEFMRCNPHWGGVSSCDQGRYVGEMLTEDMLNRLVQRNGTCVLYTHLGKIDNPDIPFDEKAIKAFHRLAAAFQCGRILVTTTRRLLGYNRAVREIDYRSNWDGEHLSIEVDALRVKSSVGSLCASDLDGLTFYVPDPQKVSVAISGRKVTGLQRNAPDHTGRPSVSIPRPVLKFPDV